MNVLPNSAHYTRMILSVSRADDQSLRTLLHQKDFSMHEGTKHLLTLCRKDILDARTRLATARSLTDGARAEPWAIIDARLWFVEMVTKDYDAELASLDNQLAAQLAA